MRVKFVDKHHGTLELAQSDARHDDQERIEKESRKNREGIEKEGERSQMWNKRYLSMTPFHLPAHLVLDSGTKRSQSDLSLGTLQVQITV